MSSDRILGSTLIPFKPLQTTYENFRYRYDKKENPYNKGILQNFREIFFSPLPPSLNDFRATVLEEEQAPDEQYYPSLNVDISSKEKIDFEIGDKNRDDDDDESALPKILRNLSYDYIEENLKSKDGGMIADPFLDDEEPRQILHNSLAEDEFNGEKLYQRSSSSGAVERSTQEPRCITYLDFLQVCTLYIVRTAWFVLLFLAALDP